MNALGSGGPAPSLDADTAFACCIQCNLSHGVVPKTSNIEAFHACYKNDSRAQVEDRLSPIRIRFVCGLFFPSVLVILQVRNCGSHLDFLSGVPCGRAISLCPISGIWKRFRVRFGFQDHSLIAKSPTNSTFIESVRGSICISQHVEEVWRYQLSVQIKIKFRVHTLLMFESVSYPSLLGHQFILNFLNSRLWTRAVGLTASLASAVSLICQAVSSCKASGRALKGFSCGSCSFLDSSLACGPCDVATSLPERPCFRDGHGVSRDVVSDND